MNPLKIFYRQAILLVILYCGCLCGAEHLEMRVAEVKISDADGSSSAEFKKQLLIKPSRDVDEYVFMSDGAHRASRLRFTSEDIEIRYVFGPSLEFSLITPAMIDLPSRNLIVSCLFKTNRDLQLFFSEQRKPLLLRDTDCVNVRKTFLFSGDLKVKIANNNLLYRKAIVRSREVGANKSYNLVRVYSKMDARTRVVVPIQEADLVFLPRTFNISALIGQDKYALCVRHVPNNAIFILRLASAAEAWNFFNTVAQDINTEIPCSPGDEWLDEHIEYLNEPKPFDLPNHPYLRER